jgi:segregation and condensation protein B
LDFLIRHIEALIFCATTPLKVSALQACLAEMFDAEVPEEDILSAIAQLQTTYAQDQYAFELLGIGGGYQFMTKPAYQTGIQILMKQRAKKRLSQSALETLAIIAYKQPVSKGQVEQIRGVNCDYAVKKLLDKQLIEIRGKSEGIGKPLLYGTSEKFLAYFGINNLADLPLPKDFEAEGQEIGETTD